MKLTPRAQGFRFRKRGWPEGEWVDIRRVGREFVIGIDQDGKHFLVRRDESDINWEKIGGTTALKRKVKP